MTMMGEEVRDLIVRRARFLFPGWRIVKDDQISGIDVAFKTGDPPISLQTILVGNFDGLEDIHPDRAAWIILASFIYKLVSNGKIRKDDLATALAGAYRLGIMPNVEVCQRCGGINPLAWKVDDQVWVEVTEHYYDLLCLPCFVELARSKGIRPDIEVIPDPVI